MTEQTPIPIHEIIAQEAANYRERFQAEGAFIAIKKLYTQSGIVAFFHHEVTSCHRDRAKSQLALTSLYALQESGASRSDAKRTKMVSFHEKAIGELNYWHNHYLKELDREAIKLKGLCKDLYGALPENAINGNMYYLFNELINGK